MRKLDLQCRVNDAYFVFDQRCSYYKLWQSKNKYYILYWCKSSIDIFKKNGCLNLSYVYKRHNLILFIKIDIFLLIFLLFLSRENTQEKYIYFDKSKANLPFPKPIKRQGFFVRASWWSLVYLYSWSLKRYHLVL